MMHQKHLGCGISFSVSVREGLARSRVSMYITGHTSPSHVVVLINASLKLAHSQPLTTQPYTKAASATPFRFHPSLTQTKIMPIQRGPTCQQREPPNSWTTCMRPLYSTRTIHLFQENQKSPEKFHGELGTTRCIGSHTPAFILSENPVHASACIFGL
jgi:hypothetical protein